MRNIYGDYISNTQDKPRLKNQSTVVSTRANSERDEFKRIDKRLSRTMAGTHQSTTRKPAKKYSKRLDPVDYMGKT